MKESCRYYKLKSQAHIQSLEGLAWGLLMAGDGSNKKANKAIAKPHSVPIPFIWYARSICKSMQEKVLGMAGGGEGESKRGENVLMEYFFEWLKNAWIISDGCTTLRIQYKHKGIFYGIYLQVKLLSGVKEKF